MGLSIVYLVKFYLLDKKKLNANIKNKDFSETWLIGNFIIE